ncbi:MAG: xanthine dehydrogenase family protein subunit M [Nitrososphaerota archaeon]|nr:xanthine dehydrogenase family protein subunit M [Nitrososphaerota archaeon]
MLPPAFDYAAPRSISEAVDLLKRGGEGAKVIAGGQSLLPLLKLRLTLPTLLVDISRIPGLEYMREAEGSLRLGAMTRMADLEASSLLKRKYRIIHDASKVIADPLVRNLGTVGGNISHGDPANDMPAVTLALDAEFEATGPAGTKKIRARDFFLDTYSVALDHEDILTEIRFPQAASRSGSAYLKVEQKVADFAAAGVGVFLRVDAKGECDRVGIGLTAVGPKAVKATKAEDALLGQKPTDREAVKSAAVLAAEASTPTSDIRGTAEYKRGLVKLLTARAVKLAYGRLRGGSS